MRVDVRGGGNIAVAQPFLNLSEAHAVGTQKAGTAMPIGYNRDKSEVPVFARGLRFVLILFPSIFLQK